MKPDPQVNTAAARHIPVASPSLTEAEAQAAADCVRSGRISQGPIVAQFEREFAEAHGKKHGVAVSNGTMALTLALKAAGVRDGSRVVLASLQMVALANSVVHLGGTPVFVDSEPHSGNPCPLWAMKYLRLEQATAIIASGLYGVLPTPFISCCRRFAPDVPIIEDIAECHYAQGRHRGDFLACSFYANKITAAGEGGIICTDDETAAERMRSLRSHAFSPTTHFAHTELAFACRWSDLQASVALVQHRRRRELTDARNRIYAYYRTGLAGIYGLEFQHTPDECSSWVFPVLLPSEDARDKLRADLAEAGVETRSWFHPLHLQEHLKGYAETQYARPGCDTEVCRFPVAEDMGRRGAYLPLYAHLSTEDQDYVIAAVRRSLS